MNLSNSINNQKIPLMSLQISITELSKLEQLLDLFLNAYLSKNEQVEAIAEYYRIIKVYPNEEFENWVSSGNWKQIDGDLIYKAVFYSNSEQLSLKRSFNNFTIQFFGNLSIFEEIFPKDKWKSIGFAQIPEEINDLISKRLIHPVEGKKTTKPLSISTIQLKFSPEPSSLKIPNHYLKYIPKNN